MTQFEESLYTSNSIPDALTKYANLLRQVGNPNDLLHAAKLMEYKSIISNKSSSALKKIADDFYTQLSKEMPELRFRIAGRRKALISVEQKIQKNLEIGKSLDLIRDMLGIRVILTNGTPDDCYTVTDKFISSYLSKGFIICEDVDKICDKEILETKSPTLAQFYYGITDYIALPKENGYRSIHVVFRDPAGICFELQVRDFEMHKEADEGAADHTEYKKEKYGDFFLDRSRINIPGYGISSKGSIIDLVGLERSIELLQENKSY